MFLQKPVHECSQHIIYNSQKVETAQMSTNREWSNTMWYITTPRQEVLVRGRLGTLGSPLNFSINLNLLFKRVCLKMWYINIIEYY